MNSLNLPITRCRRIVVIRVLLQMSTHEWDWNVVHVRHHKHPLYNNIHA